MIDSLFIAVITLVSLLLGLALGIALRDRLPEDHLRGDSIEFLRTALGVIATLVALVVGLLISSAKTSFDQASAETVETGTSVILLDRTLADYGPETVPIRQNLRRAVANMLQRHWGRHVPSAPVGADDNAQPGHRSSLDTILQQIRLLSPTDDVHRALRDHAATQCDDLLDTRWLLVEQAQNPLPTFFLVFLIGWLCLLGVGLSLIAPRNRTTLISLIICGVSMASAVFLILELNRPFEGIIQVPPDSLENALRHLGR